MRIFSPKPNRNILLRKEPISNQEEDMSVNQNEVKTQSPNLNEEGIVSQKNIINTSRESIPVPNTPNRQKSETNLFKTKDLGNKNSDETAKSEPHNSPVILKPKTRLPKEKRATSKTFISEKIDERKSYSDQSTIDETKTVNEQAIPSNNKIVNIHNENTHSLALEEAFNILDFQFNTDEKEKEDNVKNDDVNKEEKSMPKELRKRSVQSIALDNAFDILDIEIGDDIISF